MYTLTIQDSQRNITKSVVFDFHHQARTWALLNGFFDDFNPVTHETTTLTRNEMKLTTRDLFNYVNPALMYKSFLKREGLQDGLLDENYIFFDELLLAKTHGPLEGETYNKDEASK